MPIVDVPGVGEIEFPDGMSNDQMQGIIKQQFFSSNQGEQPIGYQQVPAGQPSSHTAAPSEIQMNPDVVSSSLGMFSPSAIDKTAVDYAPEIGLSAGALAPWPANLATAGMGYAAGKIYQGARQGKEPTTPTEDIANFGTGAGYELGGNAMGAVTSKALGLGWRYGKSAYDKLQNGFSMLRAGQLAEKGLPIPASAINPTEEGIALANKARQTYPGNKIVQQAHDQLRQGASEMLTEFKGKMGVDGISKEAVDTAFNTWADTMGGAEAPLTLPNSFQVIEESMGKPFAAELGGKGTWWTREAKTFLENPTVQGLRDIWSTIGGGKGADKTARQKLLGVITGEVKELYGEEAAQMLDFAKNQSSWWKKVGPLQSIIKQSYSTVNGVDTFMPDKFSRLWTQNRNKYFIKKMSKDELAQVDEFAEYMGVIGNELGQKVSDKGATSLLAQSGGLGLTATGLNMAGLPGSQIVGGLSVALPGWQYLTSRSAGKIFQPGSSVYRQMVGESSAKEIIPGLVNIGGKLFLLEGNKYREELK